MVIISKIYIYIYNREYFVHGRKRDSKERNEKVKCRELTRVREYERQYFSYQYLRPRSRLYLFADTPDILVIYIYLSIDLALMIFIMGTGPDGFFAQPIG